MGNITVEDLRRATTVHCTDDKDLRVYMTGKLLFFSSIQTSTKKSGISSNAMIPLVSKVTEKGLQSSKYSGNPLGRIFWIRDVKSMFA